ncbi:hypothetical protein M758_11G141800 [Ceratodon purpureus]|nr:hypothetical protein M758_11G141800 [Ceratodon purpureus]
MKFFGWGKNKDPQPQTVLQQANKPDARSGSHGPLDRCKSLSGMGSIMPNKGSSTTGMRKQQGLFGVEEERGLLSSARMPKVSSDDVADSEEKLQDKIRFVFSHEREGLLAIGTFALEQLQSIRNTIDGHLNATPEDGLDSSASALDDIMQSSDDEDQLQRSWIAARKTCDLPVFGDSVDTSGVESEAEKPPRYSDRDDSKALALYKPNPDPNTDSSSVKPVVLLTGLPPEIRRALDPATALLYGKSFLPHWTDAVPPPVLAKPPAPFVDEDYYSSRLCGLFSRKKSLSKSKRHDNQGQIVPAAGEEKKRLIPIELAAQETKKSILNFAAPGVPSIGKLAKLWRASCKQSTARIAPERRSPSPVKDLPAKGQALANVFASDEVLTAPELQVMRPSIGLPAGACSPKVAEFRKRVQMHERMLNAPGEFRDSFESSRDDYGHWIKDDEDFLVLEM